MLFLKRVFSMAVTILITVLIGNMLNYVLVDDTNAYSRITLHEMYETDKNIDVLFLGIITYIPFFESTDNR